MKRTLLLFLFISSVFQVCTAKQWVAFMSEHSMTNPHGYIAILEEQKEPVYLGFRPVNPWKVFQDKGTVANNEGKIMDDNFFLAEVSDAELKLIRKTIAQWNQKIYSLTSRNCVDFLEAIAFNIAVLHIPEVTRFDPYTFVSNLKSENREWHKHSQLSYTFSYNHNKFPNSSPGNELLSAGGQLLFDANEDLTNFFGVKLSVKDKEEIFNSLKLKTSAEKKQLFAQDDQNFSFPFSCSVKIIDLNKDGKPEVFVGLYNLNYFGQAGQEDVFSKHNSDNYQNILHVTGFSNLLASKRAEYPDLLIGGPGMTAPIYRWNGYRYIFFKTISFDENDAVPKMIKFEDYGK